MKARKFYENEAGNYDARHENDTTRALRVIENRIINKYAHGRSVDIGCGTLSRGAVGCDIAYNMLRKCRGKNLVVSAAEHLSFRGNYFDAVLCMFTVLNMTNYHETVKEMAHVMKRGGTAIISVSSCWDASNEPFRKRGAGTPGTKRMRIEKSRIQFHMFTRKEIQQIFEASGFELVHFESLFIFQKPYWGWLRRFSLAERMKLWLERLIKGSEAGRMYFFVFRKA